MRPIRERWQLLWVAAACLGGLACSTTGGLKEAVTAPRYRSGELAWRAAILRAEDRRLVDDAVRGALVARDPAQREAAVAALGRIGDPGFRALVEASLGDESPSVRSAAAFAVGLIGGGDSAPVVAATLDGAPIVRARAATALGLLQSPSGLDSLKRLLDDAEPAVVEAAMLALPRYESGSLPIAALLDRVESAEPRTARSALYAVSRIASTLGRIDLIERGKIRERIAPFLAHRDPELRLLAVRAFTVPANPAEASKIGEMLDDRSALVRVAVVRALSFAGASVEPYLARALKDTDERIVLAAAEGLAKLRGPDALEVAIDLLIHDPRVWVKQRCIEAIGQIDSDLGAAMANGLSREELPLLRVSSAALLLDHSDENSIGTIRRMLGDEDPRVVGAVLPATAGFSGLLAPTIEPHLASPSTSVRVGIARALAARLQSDESSTEQRDEAVSLARRLYDGAAADSDPVVRQEVLQAISGTIREPSTVDLLRRGLQDSDWWVRRRASDALLNAGENHRDRVGPATERSLSEYEAILRWAQRPHAVRVVVERPGFPRGWFTFALDAAAAPLAAHHFATLAERGFFKRLAFHRVVPGFVIQDGDPLGNGEGGPGFTVRDELDPRPFVSGTVGLATAGKDTGGSQWFVTLADTPHLEGRYTSFGHVVQGFEGVVSLILPYDRVISVEVYEGTGAEPWEPPPQ